MNIRIGKQYVNKTWKFLIPTLRGHGDVFVDKFNVLFKLTVGIHDTYLCGSDLSNGRNIYVLIDKKYRERNFKEFMSYIENQDFYRGDYCPDADVLKSRKHMLILEIPKEYHNAYDKFLQGKYSEMYTPAQVEFLFGDESRKEEYEILTKGGSSLLNFTSKVSKEFKTIVNPRDYEAQEREFPLKKKEEIFNYSGGEVFFVEEKDKVWKV